MAKIVFYKDLNLAFTPHPVTGDVSPLTDETAIRRSLLNLIKTKKGTRPFRPDFGSNVYNYLFQNGPFVEDSLNRDLYETITRYEPRVIVNRIQSSINDTEIKIEVFYTIRNVSINTNLETTIRRVA